MSENNYKVFWDEALKQINQELTTSGQKEEFLFWYDIEYVEDTLNTITASVQSDFMWVQMKSRNVISKIENKISELCGKSVTITYIVKKRNSQTVTVTDNSSINSTIGTVSQNHSSSDTIQSDSAVKSETAPVQRNETVSMTNSVPVTEHPVKKHPQMNENFTFDNFVKGENSVYPYSVALAAAKAPGENYNPLILYGGVGLGKTHLMQAIGNYIYNNPPADKPDINICFISAENFTNEFTYNIRQNTPEKFKSKFRKYDVLLIDDIHFLLGKDDTQEELFHTFEALTQRKSQIVFTCDRPLSELKGFHERLLSRCKSGGIANLQPPSFETRKAILQKKMESKNFSISDEVLDLIANNVHSSVRDLEGCLKTLNGYAEITRQPITVELAKKALSDMFTADAPTMVTIDTIQKVISSYFDITLADLKGKKKNSNVVNARQIAVYLSRNLTEYSLQDIGKEFGGRDHTTIMHSIGKIEGLLKTDPMFNSTIETLIKEIKEYKKP